MLLGLGPLQERLRRAHSTPGGGWWLAELLRSLNPRNSDAELLLIGFLGSSPQCTLRRAAVSPIVPNSLNTLRVFLSALILICLILLQDSSCTS